MLTNEKEKDFLDVKLKGVYPHHLKAIKEAIEILHKISLSEYIRDVIIFGSCARGTARFNSDVDLLVLFQDNVKNYNYPGNMMDLRRLFLNHFCKDVEVDLKLFTEESWNSNTSIFHDNVMREGISIWS